MSHNRYDDCGDGESGSVADLSGGDDPGVRAVRVAAAQGASLIVSTYVPVLFAAAAGDVAGVAFPHRSEWRPPRARSGRTWRSWSWCSSRCRRWWAFCSCTRSSSRCARSICQSPASGRTGGRSGSRRSSWCSRSTCCATGCTGVRSRERHALAAAFGPSFGGAALLAQYRALPPDREDAADVPRQPAVPAHAACTHGCSRCTTSPTRPTVSSSTATSTLRYGPLNYIVGSAETHRWHHSRVPRESNANYGNTVIVWDLVFGTWFLPREREIAGSRAAGTRLSEDVSRPDARAVQAVGRPMQRALFRAGMAVFPAPALAATGAAGAPARRRAAGGAGAARSTRIATRGSAGSTASTTFATIADFAGACAGAGVRDAAPVHRRTAADRRAGADRGAAGLLRADERHDRRSPSTFRSRRRCSRSIGTSRRCSRISSTARALPRSRERRSGSWARRSKDASTPATSSAQSRAICISRCPRSVRSRFVVPPDVLGDRRLRSEVPRHPAPRAGRAAISRTWVRPTRARFSGCWTS